MWIWLIVLLIVAALAYVRLAPHDVDRHHRPIEQDRLRDGPGQAVRVRPAEPGLLARADAELAGFKRTKRLAGSVEEGRVTYVTRSRIFGFPDYTTLEERDGQLRMRGELRFGKSDMGVNAKRLETLRHRIEGD